MKERSIFWPLVMVAAGVLWILVGVGTIPRANLWALSHLLPYLLIVLGIGLILRAYWHSAGMLISVLVVAGAMLAVVYAPRFGWDKAPGWGWDLFEITPDIGGSVGGSGTVKSETRDLAEFQSISIDYPAEVIIRQGNKASMTIEADDNLLPQLAAEIRGDTLHFKNIEENWAARVNPTEPVKLTITVVNVDEIQFPAAGKMQVEGLKTDSLTVSVSGAGDVNLTDLSAKLLHFNLSGAGSVMADGESETLELSISGMGSFDGGKLKSQNAEVQISGAGSATVWAEDTLDASISGAGSIEYNGDPKVTERISGVGSVSKVGNK